MEQWAAREAHTLEVAGSSPAPAIVTETIDNAIQQNAAGPRKASGDGLAVEQHALADQIAADKHLESRRASRAKGLGVKLVKLSPGGAV